MSTSNSATIPVQLNNKALRERERRDEINRKFSELRALVCEGEDEKHISQAKVLQCAVEVLRGDTAASSSTTASSPGTSSTPSSSPALSTSSTIGPIRIRKEIRKNREQGRRDLQGAGYEALREYIVTNQLCQQERLDRNAILDITISEIRKMKGVSPGISLPSPSVSPIIPTPAIANPPLPFPIYPNYHLMLFYYLLWLQSLAQIEVQAQIEVPKTEEKEDDDDEYIDVVN